MTTRPLVGVLALQGDVRENLAALRGLGVDGVPVRRPAELESVDALVLPGGESTTIDKLLRAFGLFEPLRARIREGLPVLGTCAGMILLADSITGGTTDQQVLGGIPMTVRRNAFGRQIDSSEVTLVWLPDGKPMHATFIRAPWVESMGEGVEVLAIDHGGRVVAVRYGNLVATAFHPEISGESRVHRYFVDIVLARGRG
ncbi:MAG: pyridoxal 5'-phosphate synthase glutaminase subunit PdxT [Demequinaceae bacterium]|nr:pyridoxal 5'-phosphate synthase glutaminase subunit PdxT [Demequinaceae bacterium]